MKDEDFDGFWRILPHMAVLANQSDLRDQFASEYKQEIVGLLGWLKRLGLAGGVSSLHPAPPALCGLCERELRQSSFFVDGQTSGGDWADMCARCFFENGAGIGWGTGQLYW